MDAELGARIEAVTRLLDAHRALTASELALKADMPMKRLLDVLSAALRDGLVARTGDRFHLPGAEPVEREDARAADALFHAQRSAAFELPELKEAVERFEAAAAERPGRKADFHQYAVTARTSVMRAYYLLYRGDLRGKDVALLGDDDLTALAIDHLGGFRSLTVFELDPDLVAFLREATAGRAGVRVVEADLRSPLPPSLRGGADTVMSDPSRRLYRCFVERSLEAARPRGAIYAFASPSHGDFAGSFLLQRLALEAGCIITDSVPWFNAYEKDRASLSGQQAGLVATDGKAGPLVSFTESLLRFTRGPSPAEERAFLHDIETRS